MRLEEKHRWGSHRVWFRPGDGAWLVGVYSYRWNELSVYCGDGLAHAVANGRPTMMATMNGEAVIRPLLGVKGLPEAALDWFGRDPDTWLACSAGQAPLGVGPVLPPLTRIQDLWIRAMLVARAEDDAPGVAGRLESWAWLRWGQRTPVLIGMLIPAGLYRDELAKRVPAIHEEGWLNE